jgi:hypothetical protein
VNLVHQRNDGQPIIMINGFKKTGGLDDAKRLCELLG